MQTRAKVVRRELAIERTVINYNKEIVEVHMDIGKVISVFAFSWTG